MCVCSTVNFAKKCPESCHDNSQRMNCMKKKADSPAALETASTHVFPFSE